MPWSEIIGLIAIIAALIGFTFAGPGNVRNISQAVFYVLAVFYIIMLVRRLFPKKSKEI